MDPVPACGPNAEPAVSAAAQDSWWALVGWRTAATTHTDSPAQDPLLIRPLDDESVAVATNRASTNISSSNTPAQVETLHGSTLSTPHGQGSSWLAPWSWYGQSTSGPAPDIVQQEERCAKQVALETETPKTAAAPTQQEPTPSAHIDIEPTNPIQSSITANISGWASFLSSRTLLAKRITDTEDREEDAMEVMDIDEGDDERSSTHSLAATSESRVRKDPAREILASKSIPVPPRSPSPSPRPKAKPDDVKGSKRASVSPAPPKGSGRASPRVPPPPNLVLPTWGDTFLIPPRSSVPRVQSDSAFTKTVRFVSGMLFAKDDSASVERDKVHSESGEHFADFGKEFPRIWDVIDEQGDSFLQGCKRVVVIGIHGWFPGTSADIL